MTELGNTLADFPVPVLGVMGRSGSGKTTLLEQLIPLLSSAGVRVGLIKHSHHDIEIDKPGKDSYRLRKAGAQQLILASPYRSFWVREGDGQDEPVLATLLQRLDATSLDLVLLEGYRQWAGPKLEVYRTSTGPALQALDDPNVVAVASDSKLPLDIPVFDLNNPRSICDWVLRQLKDA